MASADDELDRLYQLPLSEFTAARNELAKRPGVDASVKTLQKPSVPAWAVNQLYWRRRKTFDKLTSAATRLRAAHGRLLTGKDADVGEAESAHQAAVKEAMDQVRELLREAGDAESPSTLTAVQETLQALPGDDPPGRLTRPLKPKGFEALAGLVSGNALRALKLVEPARAKAAPKDASRAPTKAELAAEKRAAESRRREIEDLTTELRDAKTAERQAVAAAQRARTAHEDAQREHAQLTRRLDALTERLRTLSDDVHRTERDADKATIARERLEFRLSALGE